MSSALLLDKISWQCPATRFWRGNQNFSRHCLTAGWNKPRHSKLVCKTTSNQSISDIFRHSGHFSAILATFAYFSPKLKIVENWWCDHSKRSQDEQSIGNYLHQISACLVIVLSGHITSLLQFWVWGQNWPKIAKKGTKWPKWHEHLESDIRNHLHRISARLAIVLCGHMTSLRQLSLGQK